MGCGLKVTVTLCNNEDNLVTFTGKAALKKPLPVTLSFKISIIQIKPDNPFFVWLVEVFFIGLFCFFQREDKSNIQKDIILSGSTKLFKDLLKGHI